jgi:putative ABC transport system permease protein
MYRFALKTLIADRGKLLTALVGVVFSLVLVNVQGGLFEGLMQKASILIDNCEADIWVAHRNVQVVDLPEHIPEIYLNRVRGLPGVDRADPYIVSNAYAELDDGSYENAWLIGFDPASGLGGGWSFTAGGRDELRRPDAVSIDELDAQKFGGLRVGDVFEIRGQRARVSAMTRGILPFTTTPYLFMTLDNARRYAAIPDGYCSYFLIKASPGADLDSLCARVREQVPQMDVYPAAEFSRLSRNYWMKRTGIGISFGASTLLGVLVGLVMVAQSLYALALDHISDFATLKALGAENRTIYRLVVVQALAVAGAGATIGGAMVLLIRHFWSNPLAPIHIPGVLLFGSIGLVFVICLSASLLPFQRVRGIDPVIVLQV